MEDVLWMPIPDYEGLYEITTDGVVRNSRTGRILKPTLCYRGGKADKYRKNNLPYLRLNLSKDGKVIKHRVHRLVAMTYIPNHRPMSMPLVNHIDMNQLNNDYRNLEWCSVSQNALHYHQMKFLNV